MQQELVQSDKVAEVVLSDGRFVSIYRIKIKHLIMAADSKAALQTCKLMSLVTTIDDKPFELEDVFELRLGDYQKISDALNKAL